MVGGGEGQEKGTVYWRAGVGGGGSGREEGDSMFNNSYNIRRR